MPEGDTIHRIASGLRRDLPGSRVTRLETHDRGPVPELVGQRVLGIEGRGKHLLIHLDGGWTIRLHLGMKGKVLRQYAGDPLPARPVLTLGVTLAAGSGREAWASGETGAARPSPPEALVVCTRAYQCELVRSAALSGHARLCRLGPDLLDDPPDLDEAVRRARIAAYAEREIGELLLDQRVAAGIGNVYKSEVLFLRRIHPRTPVGRLEERELLELFREAARLMSANLHTIRRTTVPTRRRPRPGSARLWVYGRCGEPCLECGTSVERFAQGDTARSTYVCPGCQAGDRIGTVNRRSDAPPAGVPLEERT